MFLFLIPHLFERLFLISWENNRDYHITMPLSLKTMEVRIKGNQWNKRFRTVQVYWFVCLPFFDDPRSNCAMCLFVKQIGYNIFVSFNVNNWPLAPQSKKISSDSNRDVSTDQHSIRAVKKQQERSYNGVSLACLEIRSRNEEANNSTRNRIYSLRFFTSFFIIVDTFYLFRNWFSTRISDDRKHVCGSRLYACVNTRNFMGLDFRETISLPEIKEVIYMVRSFNHRRKLSACSSQEPYAYNESLQHPTMAVFFILFFRPVVFTC